jgi:hypothetical protein
MPQVGEQPSQESLSNAPFADRKAAVYCKPNVSSPTITSTAHEAATASRLAGKAVSAISSLLYLTSRSTPANGPECHWSRMYEHVDQKIRHLERALKDEVTLCREPSKIHTDSRICSTQYHFTHEWRVSRDAFGVCTASWPPRASKSLPRLEHVCISTPPALEV